MGEYNRTSTYEDSTAVFRGSVAISISPYQATPSYTALGAQTAVTITRNLQTTEEQVDDAPGDQRIFKDDFTVTFNRLETLNSTITALMFGDTDTFANTAAAPVAGATQTISGTWTEDLFYPLTGQNSSGAQPTINSVTGSVYGAGAEGTDYYITKNSAGIYGISFTTANFVVTENIVIDYDYTPAASTKRTFATGKTLTKFILKLTGANQDGRVSTWTFYKCQIENQDAISFAADDAEDARLLEPLTVTCKPDGTYNSYATGDQVIIA